jgi:sulfofructose kinase
MPDRPVVGLGQASIDFIGRIPYFPQSDTKCEFTDLTIQGGGPAATAMVTLRRLGLPAVFIGAVGDGEFGRRIVQELQDEGVDVTHVHVRPGGRSQMAFIAVESGGSRTIFWQRAVNAGLEPSDVDPDMIRRAHVLHVDGLMIEASLAAAEIARQADVPVVFDAGTLRDGYLDLVKQTDFLICSETFFRQFHPGRDDKEGLQQLHAMGPKHAVVTLGANGSLGYDGRNYYRQKAFEVDAMDTTGAGDVYHGAYIYALVQGNSLEECMRFASAVAALKCTKMGGRAGIPTIDEAERFLRTAD